jgi:hypothetical protein
MTDQTSIMRQNEMNLKKISSIIPESQRILEFSIASLYTSTPNSKWINSGHTGYIVFIIDLSTSKSYLRLYDRQNFKELFNLEQFDDFNQYYLKLTEDFHAVELNLGFIGFKFESYLSGQKFYQLITKFTDSYKTSYVSSHKNKIDNNLKKKQDLFKKYIKIETKEGGFFKSFLDSKKKYQDNYIVKKPCFFNIATNFEYNKIYRKFLNKLNPEISQISCNIASLSIIQINKDVSLIELKSFIYKLKELQIKQAFGINKACLGEDKHGVVDIYSLEAKQKLSIILSNKMKSKSSLSKVVQPVKRDESVKETIPSIPSIPSSMPSIPKGFIPPIPINIPLPKKKEVTIKEEIKKEDEKEIKTETEEETQKVSMLDMLMAVKLSKPKMNEDVAPREIKNANDVDYALKQKLNERNKMMNNDTSKSESGSDDDDW